jgi:mannose-6-phosphate isomerase-like protein (cupin superfamily)
MIPFKQSKLKIIKNEKATYSFAELFEFIDFIPKRIYFIQDCKQEVGNHCHKIEEELFILQKGSCTAIIDHGNGKEEIAMNGPGDAIYVGAYAWHAFKNFSPDAILMAVSSTNYSPDRSDYIEDYEEYLKVRDLQK